MKHYTLFFRMDITTPDAQPTPEQMELYMEQWGDWMDMIAANDQLADGGTHLSVQGKVLRPNNVTTDGPYTEKNESVAGYIIVLAEDINGAVAIAQSCPILQGTGTSLEIRKCVGM